MSRRRVVAIASGVTILTVVVLIVLAVGVVTRTEFGRSRLRDYLASRFSSSINGKFYLGRLSGSILTDLVIDSLEIRESNDSLLFATGRVEVAFDPRDLLDRRIFLSRLVMNNPVLHLTEDSAGAFNYRKIFPSGPPPLTPVSRTSRSFGDYIAVQAGRLKNLTLQVTTPWHPADSLRGARRDSAIAYNLAREDVIIRRRGSGFVQVQRWTEGNVDLGFTRVDDRDPNGRVVDIKKLDVNEHYPPFAFRNATGTVKLLGDSLIAEVTHFDLPGSTGRMSGKVRWGSNSPPRYNLTVEADSVSLADVAWVYPTLPTTGGGSLKLGIRSEADPNIIDYVLTDIDVRTTDSWLRGKMTFGVGGPVTIVKDVDLIAEPLDFKLIEALSGAPLPVPWRGTLTGTVRASGGPINRFRVESTNLVFRDANVPGAVAVGRANGELDILKPAFTVFHGFNVDLDQLDLRTLQFLSSDFPKLNGIIAGRATLDSSWLDVRFRDANVSHSDGAVTGVPTRMTGAGRVTFGENFTAYDLAMNAAPLSFSTLARTYVGGRIPLKGEYAGPMRLQGTTDDLALSTELRGASGTIGYDGRLDADSVGGYGVQGFLRFAALDLRTLLDTAVTPTTYLNGSADIDAKGDSLANLLGFVNLQIGRSLFDSIRVDTARARLHFADQRIYVDSIGIETAAFNLRAAGALGAAPGVRDSIRVVVDVDSLGGLRRYLAKAPAANGDDGGIGLVKADTLSGEVHVNGWVVGSVDTLGLSAVALEATAVRIADYGAKVARVRATLTDVTGAFGGKVEATLDSADVSGTRLKNVGLTVNLRDGKAGDFSGLAEAVNGPVVQTSGTLGFAGDTTEVRVGALSVALEDHRLELAKETRIRVEPQRVVVDTVVLVGGSGERLVLAVDVPDAEALRGVIRLDSVHLGDIAAATQSQTRFDGVLSGTATVTGTRAAPVIEVAAEVTGASVGAVKIARVTAKGHYESKRFVGDVRVFQRDTMVAEVNASIPFEAAFESRTKRLLDDTLRISARSNDIDLGMVEAFTPAVAGATGRFSLNMDIAGVAGRRVLNGSARITRGTAQLKDLGITLKNVAVDIEARNDTLLFRTVRAESGTETGNYLTLSGAVAHPLDTLRADFKDVTLNAYRFQAINRRQPGSLTLSIDGLTLRGPISASQASGVITVNRGRVRIPEFTGKKLFAIDYDEELLALDSAALANLNLLPEVSGKLLAGLSVPNVQVRMGEDVWLKSDEADIKLRGAVDVTVSRPTATRSRPELALDGTLQTERGTYRLNLGGVVQRTFIIEGGELRFLGDVDFNPDLNISALYTTRQISTAYLGKNDVRIRIRIQGRLRTNLGLVLQSADSLNLSQSDMISYLVAGVPSFGLSRDLGQNTELAAAILLGSVSTILSSRLSGGLFDYVQIQTASDQVSYSNVASRRLVDLFEGAQLGVGRQLTQRTFVSLTAGLCQFGQVFGGGAGSSRQVNPFSVASTFGVKIEHQFNEGYGVSASIEPSLSSLLCNATSDPGFSTTRRQLGLDLFRIWRF